MAKPKPKKTVLCENDNGVIYRVDKIPNSLVNFYLLRGTEYKDHTHRWKICLELAANTDRHFVIDTVRGSRKDAEDRLDEILTKP